MYFLSTRLDRRDAFVVAVRNAFERGGVALTDLAPGTSAPEDSLVHLEMQVDHVTVLASLVLPGTGRRHEFLEENPDMLQIALGDLLVRSFRKGSR